MFKVLAIAEIGLNHFGDLGRAMRMCDLAKTAGADIAKFQWYRPEIVLGRENPNYVEAAQAQFTATQHGKLKKHCDGIGIEYCVSLFHADQVGFTEDMGVKRYKVASRAAKCDELLHSINLTKKPVIVSTGGLDHKGIFAALNILQDCDVSLLYCVCKYPTFEADIDLKKMVQLKSFAKSVGFSSHCPLISPTLAAVDLGAAITENHVAIDKKASGCDISSSIEFAEFASMTSKIREIERDKSCARR